MAKMQDKEIPRWAQNLRAGTWERIGELLYDGHDTMDVVRMLKLPESKIRSLQIHARKYGPRRRLSIFAKFKDALLDGATNLGPDFARAMTFVAANAVNPDVKESTQQQACSLMIKFAETLAKMMAGEETAEKEREREERERGQIGKIDPNEAVRRVLAEYGVQFDGGKGDG